MKIGDKVIIILVIISAVGISVYFAPQQEDQLAGRKVAIVEVNGQVVYRKQLPVAETKQIKIPSNDGRDWGLIEITGARVRVNESTCPKKIVVQMG